jgi:ABC-type Zn uptake system ZnuABC Zn-binding protein ZnuA
MPLRRSIAIVMVCLGLTLAVWVPQAAAERLVAIASIFPLADMTARVGGERWQILTLIPAGASAHTYEPTPEQVRQLSRARVFFQIGLGLEFWIDKIVHAAANPALVRIDLSERIDPLPTPAASLGGASHTSTHRGHSRTQRRAAPETHSHRQAHEGADPHYWLDPLRMQQVVNHLEQALIELDAEHAASYRERAQQVRQDLEALHQEIEQRTRGLTNRSFVAMHSAWTYFASRYHLRQAAVVEPFPGREPSPHYLAELTKLMQREGVKVIVIEPQLNPAAAQALARETGARVGMLDPTGGPALPGRDSYVTLMRYNVNTLVTLLE